MQLSDSTWTDADASDADIAIVPVGSTEQHGPHAPLGTDAITAEAVAEAGAEEYGEVVVAPPIPVGVAEEHRQFPGTLWVSEDTLRSYVRETIDSLAYHGWDRVVIVNGHGGNTDALREVAGRITRHDEAYAVPFTWFEAVGDHSSEMGHGGPWRQHSCVTSGPRASPRTGSRRHRRVPATAGASGKAVSTSRTTPRSSPRTASSATRVMATPSAGRNCSNWLQRRSRSYWTRWRRET